MPKTCLEYGDHNMICHEPYGHDDDGWHYDRIDDVTWRNGRHLPAPRRDGEAAHGHPLVESALAIARAEQEAADRDE